MSVRIHVVFTVFASLVVAAVVTWGFVVVGSPTSRRLARFDEQRLQDLQTIASEIQALAVDPNKKGSLKASLPNSLAEAASLARNEEIKLTDPETGRPYGYTVKSETTYELCATFAQRRDWDSRVFWNHPAGTHWFVINVLDPPPF